MSRNIRQDYLTQAEELQPFYNYSLENPDFEEIIQAKSQEPINREALYEVIRKQYNGLSLSKKTQDNLEALRAPNTFTLTTGHQLVLFGGPLYTVYKVMTVIKLADELRKKHPAYQFVPIFWIHTEDHDFEEINHYYSSFEDKHTYPTPFQGKVGDHELTAEIEELIPRQFSSALQAAYQAGRSMADAYRRFMHHLFDAYGLLMLDADAPLLKQAFKEVVKKELCEQLSAHWVEHTSARMQLHDYPLQIKAREINLFYLNENIRSRIVKQNGNFKVLNTDIVFNEAEMMSVAEDQPQLFSPNVCLRPLYQEMILPNLAYVGGWAEVSYWLQLKDLFAETKVNFPLLLPRMSATVFPQNLLKQWEEMGFERLAIRKPLHQLYSDHLPQIWDKSTFEQKRKAVLEGLESLTSYMETESTTLSRTADALHTKTANYLKRLDKKLQRQIRQKHSASFKRIDKIKMAVEADPLVQERTWSLAALPISPEKFVSIVYENCRPLKQEHIFLILQD